MANQVIPRLTGDDYQHLYGWWKALLLVKDSENVSHVRVEDMEGGSVDDVTVYRNLGHATGPGPIGKPDVLVSGREFAGTIHTILFSADLLALNLLGPFSVLLGNSLSDKSLGSPSTVRT